MTTAEEDVQSLQNFFEDLKEIYHKQNHSFIWDWSEIDGSNVKTKSNNKQTVVKDFVHYIAYNLSKNLLHGPLPSHLHTRMILEPSVWSKKYVKFLEGTN